MHIEASTQLGDWIFFGGGYHQTLGASKRVDLFDTGDLTWHQIDFPSDDARQQGRATAGDELVFFAGGTTNDGGTGITDIVDIYDSTRGLPTNVNAWSQTTLDTPRRTLAAAHVAGWALFAGGQPSTSNVEIYDCANRQWHPQSPVLVPGIARAGMAAVTVGPYVLFSGGVSGTSVSSTINIYDSTMGDPTVSGAWSTYDLATARYAHSAAVVGTKAIIGGGLTSASGSTTASVEVYDMALGPPNSAVAWTTTATLSTPRYNMMATTSGPYAYFAGGQPSDSAAAVDTVDIYDDTTGTWSTCQFSQARAAGGAGSANGLAVFGGGFSGTQFSPIAEDAVDIFSSWDDLGNGLAGTTGEPRSDGTSTLMDGDPIKLWVKNALPGANAYFVLSVATLNDPFKGGVLVPDPSSGAGLVLNGLSIAATGSAVLSGTWPPGVPARTSLYTQWWIVDPAGTAGFAASNALCATTP